MSRTNHLDLTTIEWLERELDQRRTALVLISHDRRFLETLSRSTIWLDRGRTRRIELGFGCVRSVADEVLAEGRARSSQARRKIEAEEHWLRYGVTGRRKRNVAACLTCRNCGRKRRAYRGAAGKAVIDAAQAENRRAGDRGGRHRKAFGARPIIDNFSIRVMRGDRIGSSVQRHRQDHAHQCPQRMLAPDCGQVRLGVNVQMATLDQGRESLDPSWTLARRWTGGRGDTLIIRGQSRHVVAI